MLKSFIRKNPDFSAEQIELEASAAISNTPDFNNLIISAQTNQMKAGSHGQKKTGTGNEFWQFKEYSAGEPVDKIDWRRSANGDNYYIRQQEWEKTQEVFIHLDQSNSMHFKASSARYNKYEYGAILSYILAVKFIHCHESVSLAGSGIEKKGSALALKQITKLLAKGFPEQIHTPKQAFPVLISDFWDDTNKLEKQLNMLSAQNLSGVLFQVVTKEEMELPYKGRVIIDEADEAGAEFTINEISAVKADYKKRLKQHIDSIESLCNKHGYIYIQCRTDESFIEPILKLYTMSGRPS